MRQIIIPEYIIDAGDYLVIREDLGIGIDIDSYALASDIPKEVLFLEAIHYPFEKPAVHVGVADENALLRGEPAAGTPYEDIARKWKVSLTYDGWYRFRMFRVPVTQSTVWYDVNTATIRKGTEILEVKDLEAEPSLIRHELERFYTPKTQVGLDKLIAEKTKMLIKEGTYTPRIRMTTELVDTIDTLHAGAHEEFDEANKYDAQYIIETAQNILKHGK